MHVSVMGWEVSDDGVGRRHVAVMGGRSVMMGWK